MPRSFNPDKLIIYFHGILPAGADWGVVQEFKVLGTEATRRGYALLAMRGEQGLCYWGGKYISYWCWPSDKTQQPDMERTLRRLKTLMPKVSERLGSRIGRPLLLGFSNGGFFVAMIAAMSRLDVRAYGIMHGGGVSDQSFPPQRSRPTILAAA